MNCDYCFGKVKVVDEWKGSWTVQCCSCGVKYDVHTNPEECESKVDYKKMMTVRWVY